MALKFGPQWLRDLSDGGANGSQPGTPTMSVKFKLTEYRYGREEMLSLFQENSPPPDQVRKHLSIFSTEIQKPVTMSPLTEDEQRLVSQGFNSTVVLRAVGRSSGPPLRASRGGGTADRSRGRGRGRGEGYNLRSENGDVGYSRQTQDGWEHVGRKFERSYSRGYDESGTVKREFSRSASDNWRDKRHDDEDEDEGGVPWRNTREANTRWGPPTRSNWREPQRDLLGFEGDRRPLPPRRGFDQEAPLPRRASESYDNEGEVPEWVEDDVGDDPGTFDSSGAFVSTKEGKKYSDAKPDTANIEVGEKKTGNHHPSQVSDHLTISEPHTINTGERVSLTQSSKPPYIPPNARNGTGDVDSRSHDQSKAQLASNKGQPDSVSVLPVSSKTGSSNKGDGDTGFSFPSKKGEETNGKSSPSEHYTDTTTPASLQPSAAVQKLEQVTRPRLTNPEFLHMEKSLQNLVASMAAEHREGRQLDVSQGALPLTHEHSSKWFYKDPQGEIQGPFTNEEMSQWFSAGFFTMSLLIKRGCDDSFKQLGELIKRYGRVPFLPGPPLPPLITSISPEPVVIPSSPLTLPSFVSSTPAPSLVGPGLPSVPDPLILQHMLLQQEYLKQTFLMRQMQIQTLHQMQEQDSFKSLSPEQQQHLSMQMMAQTNPVFMQHFQQLQQQQQQVLQKQQELQQVVSPDVPVERPAGIFSLPPSSTISTATAASLTTNTAMSEKPAEESSAWASLQQYLIPGVWSQSAAQQVAPPTSLWDIDAAANGTLTPAYLAQLEKAKREKKEEKLKEEERLRQEELEKKQEEIRRQQEELERQKAQMRRELEELERQKQIELLKIEEARRQEEERIQQEIEQQQQEKLAEERRRAEEEKKRLEEERKRQQELKKQEEKKRKEEDKRRQQEEQKRQQAEARRKKEEIQQQQEWQQLEALRLQKEEEERVQKEAAERERLEAQKRQQELQRQQEAQRRLQQAQRDQLANIQLPATTNWAAQQQNVQVSPTQSRSLTDIQEEEARKEEERERELQQMQRLQEQVYLKNQQQQLQKSWATQMSQGAPAKGVSLLDIQLQEQESANKSQKEKPSTQTYQAKVALSLASASTWTGTTSGGTWSGQSVWNSSYTNTSAAIWDQVSNQPSRKSAVKESGEFPALKNQTPQGKKNSDKSGKTKVAGAKQKKEEETVQKLFQTRQQDDFSHWVMEHVSSFCAPIDVPTFVSFIVEVDSPDDVREYMKTYLGDTKESRDFARQFVEKRNYFRNQARLEKQQEEDSIWGPAPAVNPHSQTRVGGGGNNSNSANDGGEGGAGKAKNRKKKQKMQKLDGSILGFTVHADPNRKNAAGEVESIQ